MVRRRCGDKEEMSGYRIIAGRFGGRPIDDSGSERTHPMGERIRNALFNKLGSELEGAKVLDAFAGSGSLGLEALSRGAASALFIEKDRIAQKIIQKNIETLGVGDEAHLVRATVSQWLETSDEQFDIIFADPPYHDPQLSTVARLFSLLKPNGLMVLSYPGRGEAPTSTEVVVVDNRRYGNANLVFYQKKDAI
jgi:16S rRNA (guanine966-N2)-methyltransferase